MPSPQRQLIASPPPGVSRFEFGVLAIVIIIGAALRCTRIGESLWYDEVAAWIGYGVHGPGFIVSTFHDPSNHVFHTLLSWLSVTLTADFLSAELSLRLPAFIASLLAIPAMFALGRRVGGTAVGMIAAALTAVWPVCVLEGAEARGYSMMMLFSSLASLQLLIAMQKQRTTHWVLYAMWCELGAWSHMVTALVPIGHGAWLVWLVVRGRQRKSALAGLVTLALAAALTLALYAPMLHDMLAQRGNITAATARQPTLLGPEGWHMLLQLGGAWLWYAALPGMALVALGVWSVVRRGEPVERAGATATLAGLPVFVLLVALLGTWVYARFALFAVPGAALLAAFGLRWLWLKMPFAAMLAALLVATGAAIDLATRPPKQPIRNAVEFISDAGGEGSRVLLVSIAHGVLDVYVPGAATATNLGEHIEHDLATFRPRWVIVLYPDQVSDHTYAALTSHGFQERARFDGWVDWGEGDVVVYEREALGGVGAAR